MAQFKFEIKHNHSEPLSFSSTQTDLKVISIIEINKICLHDEEDFEELIKYLNVLKENSIRILKSY